MCNIAMRKSICKIASGVKSIYEPQCKEAFWITKVPNFTIIFIYIFYYNLNSKSYLQNSCKEKKNESKERISELLFQLMFHQIRLDASWEMIRLESHFNINRILLIILGLWPYKQSLFTRLQLILFFNTLTTYVLFQVYH